jgi:hypothetical protein
MFHTSKKYYNLFYHNYDNSLGKSAGNTGARKKVVYFSDAMRGVRDG